MASADVHCRKHHARIEQRASGVLDSFSISAPTKEQGLFAAQAATALAPLEILPSRQFMYRLNRVIQVNRQRPRDTIFAHRLGREASDEVCDIIQACHFIFSLIPVPPVPQS